MYVIKKAKPLSITGGTRRTVVIFVEVFGRRPQPHCLWWRSSHPPPNFEGEKEGNSRREKREEKEADENPREIHRPGRASKRYENYAFSGPYRRGVAFTSCRCLFSQLLGASCLRWRTTWLLCSRLVRSYHAVVIIAFSRWRFLIIWSLAACFEHGLLVSGRDQDTKKVGVIDEKYIPFAQQARSRSRWL